MIFQKIFILSAAFGLQSSAQICLGQNEDPCPVIEKSMPFLILGKESFNKLSELLPAVIIPNIPKIFEKFLSYTYK